MSWHIKKGEMAECTVSRCSQERRVFRKELHKWSKEILYIIGLERLAEELMGARKWQILIQPFTDLESDCPSDWFPEDTCYFCSAKKQPPYDPASGIIPAVENYNVLRIDTDEHSASSDQGNLLGSFPSCTPNLSWSNIYSNGAVTCTSPAVDQPLDLSVNAIKSFSPDSKISPVKVRQSRFMNNSEDSGHSAKSVLKVPQIPLKPGLKRKLDASSKRSYTEDELQAAIRDIQSGKLGTRRAAVIYGIPRSTLRNKVYKLANESKSRSHNQVNKLNNLKKDDLVKNGVANSELEIPQFDNSKQIVSASESLRQLLKHTITQKAQCSTKISDDKINTDSDYSTCKSINDEISELNLFDGSEYSQAIAPVLSHVLSDIQHLSLMNSKEDLSKITQCLSSFKDELNLPIIPDLIRRLAEDRIDVKKTTSQMLEENTEDYSMDMQSGNLSNVILKVPSFKPVKSPKISDAEDSPFPDVSSSSPSTGVSSQLLSGNKGITVTLKELISKSISQKLNCNPENDDDLTPELSLSPINTNSSAAWNHEIFSKIDKESASNNVDISNESSKIGKRTRPKRGRYRNYDRDNLARAVKAVQKGEMSVHRAGTFYGVPHSTLEYKVKERHLLRPRKRDNFNCSLLSEGSNPVPVPKLSSDKNIETKIIKNSFFNLDSNIDLPNKSQPHRPSMDSYPSPLSLWQNMPFFSMDFSQLGSDNFFASQMMRKLQENALNEEMQKRSKNRDVCLENIIKSTLDRSVPPEHSSSLIMSPDSVSTAECAESDDRSKN